MQNWSPEKILYFVDVRQQLHFQQAFEIAKQAGWLSFERNEKNTTELFHAYN
jgi:arginyl-tRNA synthetase